MTHHSLTLGHIATICHPAYVNTDEGTACEQVSISVIVPVHGSQPYLRSQLDALSNQDYEGTFEVLIVDNGFDTATSDVVDAALAADARFKLIAARSKPGVPAAVEAAMSHALGDLICRCDADDLVVQGWLRNLSVEAAHSSIVGGPMDIELLNRPSTRGYQGVLDPVEKRRTNEGFAYVIGGNMAFWRTTYEAVGGLCQNVIAFEDVDFCVRAQREHGATLSYAPGALVYYRFRGELLAVLRHARLHGRGNARQIALSGHSVPLGNAGWWTAKGALRVGG